MRRSTLLVAALIASACGSPGMGAPATAGGGGRSTAELEARYRASVDSALTRYSEADADFMRRMIDHHAQALTMTGLAPTRAASADVRALAARVRTGQDSEIALMRRWLRDRGLDATEPRALTGAQHSAGDHAMPGMLTPAQILELERASGQRFDSLFLVGMVQHHAGAVTMVDDLLSTPDAARDPSTFRIASGIQADQRAEIARMESMLAGSSGAPR